MSYTEANNNNKKTGAESTETVLHMDARTDSDSRYSNNSSPQLSIFRHVQHRFLAELSQIPVPENGPLCIADYGCAHGPNLVAQLRFILANISADHRNLQVFFNDLPTNDFNDLFQRLDTAMLSDSGQEVYVAGVPGSFYRELFPEGSIHLAYSVAALHWLSQVPIELKQQGSAAYNARKVSMYGNPIVAEAYAAQSQFDLQTFFRCRGHDMAAGGLLFAVVLGRPDHVSPCDLKPPTIAHELEQAWDEFISKGLLKAEQKETINFPVFMPTVQELKTSAEESGCFETLEATLETLVTQIKEAPDAESLATAKCRWVKSFLGTVVEAHIGEHYSDLLFQRVAELMAMKPMEPSSGLTFSVIFASFRRLERVNL